MLETNNMLTLTDLKEYEKFIKEKESVIVDFKNFNHGFFDIDPEPIYSRLAKECPKIYFLKIKADEGGKDIAKKEEIGLEEQVLVYYKGKKILHFTDRQAETMRILEERILEINPDRKIPSDPTYHFTSKEHVHPLIKVKRTNIKCSKCNDDFDELPEEVFFCVDCQYNFCENCRLREIGKEPVKRIPLIQPVEDDATFNKIIAENPHVFVICTNNCLKNVKNTFALKYKEVKFIKMVECEAMQKILEKFDLLSDSYDFLYFKEGIIEKKFYDHEENLLSKLIYNASGREKTDEKVKTIFHRHDLVKMGVLDCDCKICCTTFGSSWQLEDIYRCNLCDFSICLNCYKKEVNGELTVNSPEVQDILQPKNLHFKDKPLKVDSSIEALLVCYYTFDCKIEKYNEIIDYLYAAAKEHPKVQMILINNEVAHLEKETPFYEFYMNGEKILTCDSQMSILTVIERIEEFDPEREIPKDPENIFKSKKHPHPLIKKERDQINCSVCSDDFEEGKGEVYFCVKCQYNLCENCKLEEEGKHPQRKALINITDIDTFNQFIRQNKKVIGFFYNSISFEKEKLLAVAEEYKDDIKFFRMRMTDKTKELFEKFDVLSEIHNKYISFEDGKKMEMFWSEGFYQVCLFAFKFSGRTGEKVKVEEHEHKLTKMKLMNFSCDFCYKKNKEIVETAYRCAQCQKDMCFRCFEKNKKK